ncbi:hypothetical protein MMF93_02980 [Streptomyces tubbatahanensis]|uniref:Uncharacterized protein n=1 Tax=Streptomyces tubbatahanensis TaxID=2923272 RepID=A0ABY3XMB6_9ACTN|nr:hypothetical protein [Streptomyces tubbatahanensis]UNS95556.1 hypothetical protein MMF93_02980 [Streptomyces tubbatahanensis]
MRKFQRAAVAAVGLLAFSGIAAQSAQAAPAAATTKAAAQSGYYNGTFGSFSSCKSSGDNTPHIVKFHCDQNENGSWSMYVDEDTCRAATPNSTAAQASPKGGISTRGC